MCPLSAVFLLFLRFFYVTGAPRRFSINPNCYPARGDACVEIRTCPFFSHLLDNSPKPRPYHVIRQIRENQCGFQGNTPKVCCRTSSRDQFKKSIDARIEEPPDVRHHRNIRLLPQDMCGYIAKEFRITSGTQTTLEEFPWMALVAYMSDDVIEFKCGGTLINERYVLTAAHCVKCKSVQCKMFGVRLGEYDINNKIDCDESRMKCSPPVQDFYVEEVKIHPDYNDRTLNNDIALLRLATPANFSYGNVRPICLPIGDNARTKLDGKFAVVTGWGITEHGYKSPELLKTSIPIISYPQCQRIYKKHSFITFKQICAGGYMGRDSCGGDSGGPLKFVGEVDDDARYLQYGIVSYGPRYCGAEGQPGIYTNVPFYMKWILDSIDR